MPDVFSKSKRSQVMSRIRGGDNRSTERALAALLRAHHISGWTLRARGVLGRPDIYFPTQRLAIFVDGCFWHGCRRCFIMPAQNRAFWREKIGRNIARDRTVTRSLQRSGAMVLRLWEHDIERRTPKLFAVLTKLKVSLP